MVSKEYTLSAAYVKELRGRLREIRAGGAGRKAPPADPNLPHLQQLARTLDLLAGERESGGKVRVNPLELARAGVLAAAGAVSSLEHPNQGAGAQVRPATLTVSGQRSTGDKAPLADSQRS